MAEIIVQSETAIDRGWAFQVRVRIAPGKEISRTLRLSWADYDLWSRGAVAPERVARAVIRFAIDQAAFAGLRPEFDAAALRRSHPHIDLALPGML